MQMKNTLALVFALPLLSVSCSMFQTNGSAAAFREGMQRSSIGVNEYRSTTLDSPAPTADVDTTSLSINFTHGWFVMPELEVGGKLAYTDSEVGTANSTMYDLAAYGRWYFDTTARLRPWAQASFGIGNLDAGATDDDSTTWIVGGGVTDMISDDVAIDLGLDYRSTSWDKANTDDTGFFLTAALSIFYGN
jgi:hypothetical protein